MTIDNFEVIIHGGSGTENGAYQYRVLHLKEQLDFAGIPSKIIPQISDITKLNGSKNKILVLHRVAWDSEGSFVKKFAKEHSIPLVYDIDDYVFEPKIIPTIRGVDVLPESKKDEYNKTVKRYRDTLVNCDFAIAATDYLKDRVEELGIKSFVHRNALKNEIVTISEKIRNKKKNPDEIILGYFSGTYTHNYDFKECSDAVLQIFQEFKDVKLMVVGPVDLSSEFDQFSDRIMKHDLVNIKKVPELLSKVDINLAALEPNNSFSQAKSELKYFEAGIANVPTIASAIGSYQHAISNGKNGFIAHNKEEWMKFLRELITDEELRRRISSEAVNDCYSRYTNKARSKDAKLLFQTIIQEYQNSKNSLNSMNENVSLESRQMSTSLKISWAAPTPEPFQGGFRLITRNCRYLTKFGHDVTLYVDPGSKFRSENEIKKFIEKYYGDVNYNIKLGHSFSECDVLIATFWTTAYNVNEFTKAKVKAYFVQDFEPYFYQMGSEYVLAENSYKLGLNHVTVLPWLPPLISKRFGGKAEHFFPPLERGIYNRINKEKNNEKLKILFYARPDQPRRCYQLGIQALNIVSKKIKNIDIILFGSKLIDEKSIPFPHTNKKSLPTNNDLAKLYQSGDLGIVFSTTNPSLLSYEMMACGCPVVDLDNESNRFNYGSEENAALCEPTPNGVAKKVIEFINNSEKRKTLAENGYKFSLKFPDEETSARQVEELLIKIFHDDFGNKPIPTQKQEEQPSIDFEKISTDDLATILIDKISSKMDKFQTDVDTLTESHVDTTNKLKRLQRKLFKISETFPLRLGKKILKKYSKKFDD